MLVTVWRLQRLRLCVHLVWMNQWVAITISKKTDAFVLWGSNMAEMHPILWSRISDRRLSSDNVKVVVMSTFEHRSF